MVHNGKTKRFVHKGIYGLKLTGCLHNEKPKQRLAKYDYQHTKHMPGLWNHKTNKIMFVLVVNDLIVKYYTKESLASNKYPARKCKELDVN